MRLFLLFVGFFSLSASAELVNAYSCQAHCLKINWTHKTILSHGIVKALGHEMPEAFENLSLRCSRWVTRQLGQGRPLLVDGNFNAFPHRTRTPYDENYSWRGVVYSWKFLAAYPTSTDSWEIRVNQRSSVFIRKASTEASCSEVVVEEDEILQY